MVIPNLFRNLIKQNIKLVSATTQLKLMAVDGKSKVKIKNVQLGSNATQFKLTAPNEEAFYE